VPKSPSIPQPPVEKKKMSGWVIALIVLLVLCICVVVPIVVVIFMVASGDYRLEWSYLINSALSML
jgi:flagellar basal body-associated protein FliL